jgi:hypothetical protein
MTSSVDQQTDVRRGYHDAAGALVETREEAFAAPRAATTGIRLTLHNGGITFEIQAEIDPNTYPFRLTGGEITSGICGAPWSITGGHVGDDLRLDAKRAGSGSCADTITVVGEYAHPGAYRGTYGFNGTSGSFRHTTWYQA